MELIRKFEELGKNDADIAGGKGASLGEMTQAEVPVPPGFVVLSSSFEQFLKETDLNVEIDAIIDTVKHEEMHTVEHASEKIQGLVLNSDMPENIQAEILTNFKELGAEYVAVRSSATAEDSASAAWAGQLDSFLNTTEATLLQNVRQCWASLFTPRAIFYRFEKELHKQKISVAVVVQKMVNSEKSGIAFSVHPVTEDRNQLIIEAGFGLGEAIVSGSVTPDSYVVTKTPREILDINISSQGRALYRVEGGGNEWKDLGTNGDQQVLTEKQVKELSTLIIKIEDHYGFPCDIEWAFENNIFYITQSRPITTLKGVQNDNREINLEFINLWEAKYDVAWTEICASIHDAQSPYKQIVGSAPNNVIYFGDSTGMTAYYVPNELEESSRLGYKAHAENGFIEKYCKNGFDVIDSTRKLIDDVKSIELSKLSNDQIADLYQKYALLSEESVAYYKLCNDEFQEQIADEIRQWFISRGENAGQAQEYLMILASEEKNSTLDEFNKELTEIVQVDNQEALELAEKVSDKYGWMGTFESGNFWDSNHILSQSKNAQANAEDKSKKKDQLISKLQQKFEIPQKFLQYGHQMSELANLKLELRIIWSYRDYYIGKLKEEIINRLDISKDAFYYLRPAEIIDSLKSKEVNISSDEIENRKAAFGIFIFDGRKQFYSGDDAIKLKNKHIKTTVHSNTDQIKGQIAMRGKITGIVKIISPFHKLEDELKKVQKGDILVTGMTRPQMIPAMHLASAFVTDEGGVTCHAAIVAREMGKPCIIATRTATKILKDGDLVEVDADNGYVTIIK